MRTLGVTCSPGIAHLSLAVDGKIVDASVGRVEVASQREASEELIETLGEISRAYSELSADRVVILRPESGGRKQGYEQVAPRVALETLFRVAAVQAGLPVELIARPTVRSRLGLPKSSELASHVPVAVPEPVGPYWRAGRDLAALAALAAGEDG